MMNWLIFDCIQMVDEEAVVDLHRDLGSLSLWFVPSVYILKHDPHGVETCDPTGFQVSCSVVAVPLVVSLC